MIHYAYTDEDAPREDKSFSVVEIPFPSAVMNAAEITLTSRYPQTGFALNRQSEMFVRILDGGVRFECEGEEIELLWGAVVLIETNKKYCWVPYGSVTLYVVSSPPWTPGQQELLP